MDSWTGASWLCSADGFTQEIRKHTKLSLPWQHLLLLVNCGQKSNCPMKMHYGLHFIMHWYTREDPSSSMELLVFVLFKKLIPLTYAVIPQPASVKTGRTLTKSSCWEMISAAEHFNEILRFACSTWWRSQRGLLSLEPGRLWVFPHSELKFKL